LAEIDGQRLDHRDFQQAQSVLGSGQDAYATRDYLWDFFVEQAIVNSESEDLGLAVSKDELLELEFGTNLSPVIQRNLADPNTRQVNRDLLNQYKEAIESGQLEGKFREFWKFQEKQIIKERLQAKLNSMVSKGMYMPSWRVKRKYRESNDKLDMLFVKVAFDEIDDSEVQVTDEDLEKYIKEHAVEYTQTEETRSIAFVSKEVFPTAEDSTKLIEMLEDLKEDFINTSDDSLFIENNYGILEPAYVNAETLAEGLKDTIADLPVGGIYGPYMDGAQYRLAKLLDAKVIPDSVEVRHILRRVQSQPELQPAISFIDSIKTLIEGGMPFDSMAILHSQDPGSGRDGGALGYTAPGKMVPSFNDVIFYKAETGKLYTTISQFGVHLIEVTDKKFLHDDKSYRVAYLKEDIIPSELTQQGVYDEMAEVMTNNRTYDDLKKYADEHEELTFEVVNGLKKNDHIVGTLPSSPSSRDIVRWTFDPSTEIGDVAPEVYAFQAPLRYNNKYVVPTLTGIYEPGLMPVEIVRDEISDLVKSEKKSALIMSQIKGEDLNAISQQFDTKIDTANGVSFFGGFLPGSGSEPAVVGKAFGLKDGGFAVVKGSSGVYAIKRLSMVPAVEPNNLSQLRKINTSQYGTRVSNSLISSFKKVVDIEDNRFNYY